MTGISEKFCGKCKQVKPVSEFYPARTRNGYHSWCKECARVYLRKPELKAIPRFCGACGADIEPEWKGVMLCKAHRPRQTSHEGETCSRCQFEMQCCIRVQNGIWVLCEIPDEFDIKRARAASIPVTFDKRVLERRVPIEMDDATN